MASTRFRHPLQLCASGQAARHASASQSLPVGNDELSLGAIEADYLSMHEVAPVTNGGSDEVELSRQGRPGDQDFERIVSKWALLWKSIILSSMDMTLFPYCRYIRALNLRDLKELLEDSKFRTAISQ